MGFKTTVNNNVFHLNNNYTVWDFNHQSLEACRADPLWPRGKT